MNSQKIKKTHFDKNLYMGESSSTKHLVFKRKTDWLVATTTVDLLLDVLLRHVEKNHFRCPLSSLHPIESINVIKGKCK